MRPGLSNPASRSRNSIMRQRREDFTSVASMSLVDANKMIDESEKNIRQLKAKEMREDYERQRSLLLEKRNATEAERESLVRERHEKEKSYQEERAANQLQKQAMRQALADSLKAMQEGRKERMRQIKEKELLADIQMLDHDRELVAAERKQRMDKRLLSMEIAREEMENERQKRNEAKRVSFEDKLKYQQMSKENAQKEVLKEQQYRQWFRLIDENQRRNQQRYLDNIGKPVMEREKRIQRLISSSVNPIDQRRDMEEQERLEKVNRGAEEMKKGIDKQLEWRRKLVEDERQKKDLLKQQSLKAQADLEEAARQARLEKQALQKNYKKTLDNILRNDHNSLTAEPSRNEFDSSPKSYDNYSSPIGVVPGFGHSKYIHPYSFEARYHQAIPYRVVSGKNNLTSQSMLMSRNSGYDNSTIQKEENRATVTPVAKREEIFSPARKASLPTIEMTSPNRREMKLELPPPPSPQLSQVHNPITNPNPYAIQNPYIRREVERAVLRISQSTDISNDQRK
eukprot:TRINITY_DN2036_c0_g4_i1.p1 TRINITY_DN2036_c0_g4~~TRINITY_DN2036_c0_g4_i1.p1  ORF type:complete len:514 (-),score=108.07 TRINITY_DN2036_c0_g4_i1:43-1584(-)